MEATTFRKYQDNSQLDTELLSLSARGSYQGSRLDTSASMRYHERQTTTGDANVDNDLIESEISQITVNSEYQISPKLSLAAGIHLLSLRTLSVLRIVFPIERVRHSH